MTYDIISTGSAGNCVIFDGVLAVDMGVSFKSIKKYIPDLKLVLLTHIHSDHFNRTTIKRLAAERPTMRFGCRQWLAAPLIDCGVNPRNVDILAADVCYNYGLFKVIPVDLVHDVPNCGYKIHFSDGKKVIYCTDTNNLNGITAKNYDLYMIEANYTDEEIKARIDEKQINGEYAYEYRVLKNHLSKAKCDDFIYKNIGANGTYIYMHQHKG